MNGASQRCLIKEQKVKYKIFFNDNKIKNENRKKQSRRI